MTETPRYLVEFPDYGPLDFTVPEGFVDTSWHNDGCPSWINHSLQLRFMANYANSGEPYLRFTLDPLMNGQVFESAGFLSFATIEEVNKAIDAIAAGLGHSEALRKYALNLAVDVLDLVAAAKQARAILRESVRLQRNPLAPAMLDVIAAITAALKDDGKEES